MKKFKIFGLFNLLDIVIVISIIFVLLFIGRLFNLNLNMGKKQEANILIEFYIEEVSNFVVENMNIEDNIEDIIKKGNLGTVKNIETTKRMVENKNRHGELIFSEKEDYSTQNIQGLTYGIIENNGVKINNIKYNVGNTVTLRIGKTEVRGRISKLEIIN